MFKIDNEFSNANVSRTVRFTENLFERLNETATKNNISFNLLVLQCCKYARITQDTLDFSKFYTNLLIKDAKNHDYNPETGDLTHKSI